MDDLTVCLSGGGFRASVFHLGALTWLNQTGALAKTTKISSVSGGSIISGFLVSRFDSWARSNVSEEDWINQIVEPFRSVVGNDMRTAPLLARLLPQNWLTSQATVRALESQYRRHLFSGEDVRLSDLPEIPRFVFCATDMTFGVNWEFTRERTGDYVAGYVAPPPNEWTVSRAIAASSCFPPIFPPMKPGISGKLLSEIGEYRCSDRDNQIRSIRLTDGGVYDNLGLQPAMQDQTVFVSDGGGQFEFVRLNLPWRRIARYPALLQNGIGKLRRSWFLMDLNRPASDSSRKEGTYWSIEDSGRSFAGTELEKALSGVAGIRTDLNKFSDAEFELLINAGYSEAARKTIRYSKQILPQVPDPVLPYQNWNDPRKVRAALALSQKRFVPFRNWRTRRNLRSFA